MTDTHHSTGSFWKDPKRILGTTNATEIAYLYFVAAFINAAISGLYALLIRIELWDPEAGTYFSIASDYNSAFTLHGTSMIFMVIIPLGAAMGNLLIPRMVASVNADMYWPKWNNVAFWMLPVGSLMIWLSQSDSSWVGYPPYSVSGANAGVDMWILGLTVLGLSSTIGAINFILTIWKGRDQEIGWMDLDLFVWGTFLTSVLLLLTTPSVTIALILVLFDRNLFTSFFFSQLSGGTIAAPIMYQHLFWFFAHPEVYVMVMPAFGLISHIIAKYSRSEIFGYVGMVAAFIAITVLSFLVWAHHMYTTGMNPLIRVAFTTMTFVIAIPSGIKVFNWLTTLYGGNVSLKVPMLFALSFLIMFTLGGITGVYVNIVPIDIFLHDTYWVVGHFHFVVAAGSLQAFFAAIYYFFPDMTGKTYHKLTAKLHFWTWSIGNFVTFTAFTILGFQGMPRRYYTYDPMYQPMHQIATIGAFFMGISFIFFLASVYLGWSKGEEVTDFDNIDGLGSGYDFPKPFAERMKEEEGVDIEVDHSLSMWAPSAGFMLTVPLWAIMAFLETGIFGRGMLLGTLRRVINLKILGYLLMAGFLLWVAALFYDESKKEKHESNALKYKGSPNWEMWVFLASETVFFGILIGVGIAMRLNASDWPDPASVLDVPLTAVNTFILIISSFTMAKSIEAIGNGDQQALKRRLAYTIILGTIFIGIQMYEYMELFSHGEVALIEEGAKYPIFSSAFFLQTGFHGAHVTIGIVMLIFVLLRAHQGGYSADDHKYVEFVGLYWHFVDLVWIVLFTVVYLI